MTNPETRDKVSIKSGLIAGFLACCVSGMVLIIATSIAAIPEIDHVNYTILNSAILKNAETLFLSAWSIYFITGIFLHGGIYAIVEPYFKGRGIVKGTKFGIILWFGSLLILIILSTTGAVAAKSGLASATIALLTSLSFGMTVGYFYARLRRKPQPIAGSDFTRETST